LPAESSPKGHKVLGAFFMKKAPSRNSYISFILLFRNAHGDRFAVDIPLLDIALRGGSGDAVRERIRADIRTEAVEYTGDASLADRSARYDPSRRSLPPCGMVCT
jgi:hypothetical protein